MAYATPAELASFLHHDVDAAAATLALDSATALFVNEAGGVSFTFTSGTYSVAGSGAKEIFLPGPVIAVSAVRVNGVAVTDYTRIGDVLYRQARFGSTSAFPPDLIEVDYTGGYSTIPDDVKLAVLQLAGNLYENPGGAVERSERIDDYSLTEKLADPGEADAVSPSWREVAAKYRAVVVA